MAKSIFIIGTDTDIGKTFVSSGLTYTLNQNGYKACCYKPVQSGRTLVDGKFVSQDIDFAMKSSHMKGPHSQYNTYCFKEEVSPHLAAEIENINIDISAIIDDYKKLTNSHDYVIVEGVGGIIVPIIRDKFYIYNLIKALDIPVVLVCKPSVGTINHTALTVSFLRSMNIDIKGLIVNGYTDSFYEHDNLSVLKSLTDLPVISVLPQIDKTNSESFIKQAQATYQENLHLDSIIDIF